MDARQGRDAVTAGYGGLIRHAHDSATGHLPGAGDACISMTSLLGDQMEHAGTMSPVMMNAQELQDDELTSQAREWRRRALRGEKDARGIAHELEREVRHHRFGARETAVQPPLPEIRPLGIMLQPAQRRWKPW